MCVCAAASERGGPTSSPAASGPGEMEAVGAESASEEARRREPTRSRAIV